MREYPSPLTYEEPVFRPPSEGESFLLQVTIGCSHNHCTYCDMYRSKKYRVRERNAIEKDIFRAAKKISLWENKPRKAFLCDGDALGADDQLLLYCLEKIQQHMPWTNRIGSYATATNILGKDLSSLTKLKQKGLEIAYLGMETGSAALLKKVVKDATAEEMIEASLKVKSVGIKLSTIVMIGLGGKEFFESHALETAAVLSKTRPEYLSFLVTRPVPGTPYYKMVERGNFTQLSEWECFQQMKLILENLNLTNDHQNNEHQSDDRIIFRANHVSNFLPIGGTLPRDRNSILSILQQAQRTADKNPLSLNFNGPM
jgi:radical SAM superfamily enzyme YgiQ (UPF0313 family)